MEQVGTKTFLEAPCKSDISIYYTTTQKDNYFTAINYLLNRMYMEPSSFDVDNHPRIILWDEKERKYRMAKLNDDSTSLRTKHNFVQLNRFYEISDYEVNPYAPGMGGAHDIKPSITSLSKMSYTRFIKDYYTRHYWDLNITKDKFVRRIIMNEKLMNTFKSPNACPKRDATFYPNPDITSEESVPDLQQFLGDKTLYLIDESKWSNQRHLYNDCRSRQTIYAPYQPEQSPDELEPLEKFDASKLNALVRNTERWKGYMLNLGYEIHQLKQMLTMCEDAAIKVRRLVHNFKERMEQTEADVWDENSWSRS